MSEINVQKNHEKILSQNPQRLAGYLIVFSKESLYNRSERKFLVYFLIIACGV